MIRLHASLLLLLLLFVRPWSCHGDELPKISERPIRVGAFNIQVFGVTKMSRPDVVRVLLTIVQRYDLLFIMEIRDASGQAIRSLLRQVNERISDSKQRFDMAISERLGRTASKEQYAFFYRRSKFRLLKTFQDKDKADVFERPPYGALFEVEGAEKLRRLAVLGIHAAPSDAVKELQQLHRVQKQLRADWGEDLLIVGDFNADCFYVRRFDYKDLLLVRDQSIEWLITGCHVTTAVRTNCLYDRILTAGAQLALAVKPQSARVYYFDDELRISRELALQVSDHYPVELQLKGRVTSNVVRQLRTTQSVEVTQPSASEAAILRLHSLDGRQVAGFSAVGLSRSGRPHTATAELSAASDPAAALGRLAAAVPGLLHADTVAYLRRRSLPPGAGVSVSCRLAAGRSCTVRVAAVVATAGG